MTAAAALELMKYGGVELRRNYRRYLGTALGIATAIHLVFMTVFWIAQHLGEGEKLRGIPVVHLKPGDLAPPPSIQQNFEAPVSVAAPVAKPSVGVPVPVPDAEVSPEQEFATLKQITEAAAPVGDATGVGTGAQVQLDEPVKIDKPAEDAYQFLPVEKEPVLITNIRSVLEYPELARKAGLEGHVQIRFKVLENGTVGEVFVERSDQKIFDQAAMDAIRKCKFTPAIQDKQPVTVWVSQTIEFKLK